MTKKQIQQAFKASKIESHYSGKTKTFYLDCSKHYQSLLINLVEELGFKVIIN